MTAPTLSSTLALPNSNGVQVFTGTADPGVTIEIGQRQTGGGFRVIGTATADADGAWSFAFPRSALGYGIVDLAACEVDTSWNAGAWGPIASFTFADPETGLQHLGDQFATQLLYDQAHGLDATADLQAVANLVQQDGPGALDIPAGTYRISNAILLYSGTYFDAPGVTLEAASDWQRPAPGSPLNYAMIANVDYAASTIIDQDIQVRNVSFIWNGFDNHGGAAIRFINAENLLVQNTQFVGGDDGTAFEGDDGAVVNGATATGTTNYAYDNWDGPQNTVIENSVAIVRQFSGIAFTGRGTAATANATGNNLSALDDQITGADNPGIEVEALSSGSQVNNVFVAGNTIAGPGIGVSITGSSTGDIVLANSIAGNLAGPSIRVSNLNLQSGPAQVLGAVFAGNILQGMITIQAGQASTFGNTPIAVTDLSTQSGTVQLTEGSGDIVRLGIGMVATVISDPASGSPGTIGYGAPGYGRALTILASLGANSIELGAGDDTVILSSNANIVRGGGGNDTFYITAASEEATIDGGEGDSQVIVVGGGTVTLGAAITDINTVKMLDEGTGAVLTLTDQPGQTAIAGYQGDTLIADGLGQTLESGAGIDTLVGGQDTTFTGRAAELEGDQIEDFGFGDTVDVSSVSLSGARYAVHINEVPGMTTLFVLDGHDGTAINIAGTLDGTRFHLESDPSQGVRAVYALGTFTVGTAADLTHVLSVVGTDTTDTLLLGAYLPVGGTLALTADLAPVTLVPGATLALDGAGHTLDAQSHAALDIISGQLSLSDLTLAGAWGVHVGTAATLDIGLATDFADGGIVLDGDHVTLSVAAGAHPATTIYGLSDHDVFLAEGITNGSARYDQQAGRLTIAGNGGTLVLPIESTNPISGSFLVSQTLAGTRVTYIACYVAGTLIATPLGEQPIETLRIGDLVHTSTNGPCPIRWIGWQRYEKSEIRKNPLFRPVRIRAGALSPGVPRRDLLVSATHGIFLDGALVIAGALVNGTTILRDPPGAVTYLHLALHSHELLLAEHTLAESYVDLGGSNLFTHPPRIALPKPAFTRLDHHPHAPPNPGKGRLRGHIEQVADGTVAGWALDDGGPRLALELLAFPHAPIPILANRYRGDLDDAGLAEGVCGFSQKLPPGLKEVLVRRQIDGMALPNSAGCHTNPPKR